MVKVLDSGAMLAFLRDEPGGAVTEALFLDPTTLCVAHAVNLCEVFYDFLRTSGEVAAQKAIADLLIIGLQIQEDMDAEFWQSVGRLKVNPGRIAPERCRLLLHRSGATDEWGSHYG